MLSRIASEITRSALARASGHETLTPREGVRGALSLCAPLVALAAATCLIAVTGADMAITRLFYDRPAQAWIGNGLTFPWWELYRFAELPAYALGLVCWLGLLGSCLHKSFASWRRPCCYLLLVLIVGPGLLVNLAFKNTWGRPRPRQVVEFGGEHEFAPVLIPGPVAHNSSFPSGHAAAAFYLFAPAFIFRRQRRALFIAFITLGIGFGVAVGLGRMLQGAHFASDVLWSAGLMYLTVILAYGFIRPDVAHHGDSTDGMGLAIQPRSKRPTRSYAA